MGDLWFSLGVRSNIAKEVNRALRELKNVDGAISALNRKYIEAQDNLRRALGAQKADSNLVKSLREEVQAWSKGVDNALAYQGMLQKVKKELDYISNLKKLNIGVNTTELSEAETLLRNFRKDLTQVTYEKLGGTDANTFLSKFRKALRLTLNDVKSKVDSFRKDNSLTDAANRAATLERALANVQKRLLDIKALQSEAWKGNYNGSSLLSAGNRLRGVEGRIQKMFADPSILNNEAKYRSLISDIGTAAAKATLDIERYNASKKAAQDARITSDKEKRALDETTERFSKLRSILSEGLNVRRGGSLTNEEVSRLNLGLQGLMQKVLELRSAINSGKGASNLFNSGNDKVQINDLEHLIRLYQKLNDERERNDKATQRNYSENYEKAVSALTKVNDLLSKTYEARNRGKALGLDTSRLEKDIQTLRELRTALEILKKHPNDTKGLKNVNADTEARLANILRHIKDINSNMRAARSRTNEAAAAARDLASAFDKVHNSAQKSSRVISDIKSLFLQGGVVFAAQQFARSVIQTGGDIAQQHIALRSILGDVQKADEIFAHTQELALQSPFKFQELNRDVKQLAAFGVDTDRLYDTTKRLADVASGLGVSFERLGLAYGQVKARSWLDGKELRQFAYAGLPMLQKIADLYNETGKNGRHDYTTSEVRTMITKRMVSFEDVDKVIQRLTDAGGQFYNMQFVLSETLLGRWNKLEDAWTIMLGKFADGENILGRVFSTAIDGATNLVLSLDKISPLLLSFGTMFAGRKLFGAAIGALGVGSSGISKQMAAATQMRLKDYAVTQMQAVAEGEITTKMAEQNILKRQQLLASTRVKDMAYAQMLAEGKISTVQLAQLARRKQVSQELVSQLRIMGLISAKQEQLILQAVKEGGVRAKTNMAMLGAGQLTSKLGGLLTPANVAMVGASIGMSLWMGYSQWSARIEQASKAALDHAKQEAKSLQDAISAAKASGPTELSVKNMEEIVNQSDLYTGTMQKQVEHAGTLQEKYNALLAAMKEMKETSELMQNYSEEAEGGIKATSLGPGYDRGSLLKNYFYYGFTPHLIGRGYNFLFNDDLNENMKNYTSSRTQYDNSVGEMKEYADQIHSVMNGIRSDYEDTYNTIQGKSFEEQLRILSQSDAWDKIVEKISENDRAFKGLSKTYIKNTDDVDSKWTEIVEDDIPKLLSEFAYQRNQSLEEYKEYCKEHPKYTAAMIRDIVNGLNEGSAETKSHLVDVLLEFFGIARDEAKKIKGEATKTEYQKQTNIGKKVMGAVVGKYGNGVLRVEEVNMVAGAGDDWAAVKGNIQKRYNEANENYVAARGNPNNGEKTLAPLRRERDKWAKVADANGITVQSKSDREAAKRQRKAEAAQRAAERAREKAEREEVKGYSDRINLYQKFYSEYKKLSDYMGDGGALDSLRKSGDFGSVFKYGLSDVKNYSKSIDELTKGLGRATEERAKLLDDANASKATKAREKMMEDLESSIKDTNQELEEMEERYEVFKKIVRVNGDRNLANVIAFDRFSGDTSAPTTIRGNIKAMLMNRNPGWTDEDAETFLNLDRGTVSSTYGMKSDLGNYWEAGQKDVLNRLKEAKNLYVELIADHQTTQEKIDAENRKYKEQIELINMLNQSPAVKARLTENLTDTHTKTLGDLEFQKFKESSGWEAMFRDLDRVTADSIRGIFTGLRGTLSTNNMSEETVKTIVEAMERLQESLEKKSPIRSISEGYGTLAEISRVRSGGTNANGNYILSREQAARFGLPASKTDEYTPQQLKDVEAGVFKGFENSISGISEAFDGLQKVMQPVADLFAAMDAKGLSEGMGIGSNAIGAMSNTMSGFDTMSKVAGGLGMDKLSGALGNAGPYGAIAAAGISVVSSIVGMKTSSQKAYERQAAYLKSIQSTTSEINSSLKSRLSQSYGSSAQIAGEKIRGNYQTEAEEVRETYLSWSNAKKHTGGNRNRVKTNVDYDELNEFLRASGWNGELTDGTTTNWIGAQSIQLLSGKWLEKYREAHAGSWANINSEAREYLERLIEIEGEEGELKNITDEISKSLADFDTETLKSEYKDLLDDLDSTNEDFADSFEKHMRSAILSTMLANLYSSRITELSNMTADAFDTTKGEYLSKSGVVKHHTGGDDSSDVLSEYTSAEMDGLKKFQDELFSDIRSDRDRLVDYFGWSDKNSSSMSSSIQGISETTGDLLAAYLNAIRADVSVIRQLDGVYWPKIDITTQAQLQRLNMITDNTRRNAEAAERIETSVRDMNDMFSKSFMGINQLSVRVQ